MQNVISQKEYGSLVFEMSRLQLYFLWNWVNNHPEDNFKESLRNRIDLCRKTDPSPKDYDIAKADFKKEEWTEIENDLNVIFKKSKNDVNAENFEDKAFLRIEPTLIRFVEKTYGSTVKMDSFKCGSLTYDPPSEERPEYVEFHIANAVAPKSIFEDSNYLKECFLDLIDKASNEFNITGICTKTWLNSLPKWLEYFPKEWHQNLGEPDKDVKSHFGFWGQFVSARGTFNHKYANHLRTTKEFVFWPRYSCCSFDEMKRHLTEKSK